MTESKHLATQIIFIEVPGVKHHDLLRCWENLRGKERRLVVHSPIGYSSRDFALLPRAKLSQYTLFAGYMPFGLHRYLGDDCAYVTGVSQPSARLARAYTDYREIYPQVGSMEDFVRNRTPANLLTTLLSGGEIHDAEKALAAAKANLETHFYQMEFIPDDADFEMAPELKTFIEQRDSLDIELYAFARSWFAARSHFAISARPANPAPSWLHQKIVWLKLGFSRRSQMLQTFFRYPNVWRTYAKMRRE